MQTHASVFRDGPTLKEGCKKIDECYKEMNDLKVGKPVATNVTWVVTTVTIGCMSGVDIGDTASRQLCIKTEEGRRVEESIYLTRS